MFKSNMTVKALLEQTKADSDIAVSVSDDSLLFWYNQCVRFLYLDVIRDDIVTKTDIIKSEDGTLLSVEIPKGTETVITVICDGYPQLERVSALYSVATARPCFYESTDNKIVLCNIEKNSEACYISAYEVPDEVKSITSDNYVPLPDGFCSLMKYKLLAEMYNASNDDDLSAKYFGFYNAALADFRLWLSQNSYLR